MDETGWEENENIFMGAAAAMLVPPLPFLSGAVKVSQIACCEKRNCFRGVGVEGRGSAAGQTQ